MARSLKVTLQESPAARPLHASTASAGTPGGGPLGKQARGASAVGPARQVPSIAWPFKVTVHESPAVEPLQASSISGGGPATGGEPSACAIADLAAREPAIKSTQHSPLRSVIRFSLELLCAAQSQAPIKAPGVHEQARCHRRERIEKAVATDKSIGPSQLPLGCGDRLSRSEVRAVPGRQRERPAIEMEQISASSLTSRAPGLGIGGDRLRS